ncbi:hypothetical protein DFQ05_1615 [Winogradskyella wandonensis]|uniref:Outer membrane protein with beta-barrel domain n=1 Tax=Winogradskyella wandonensis TaxID=1442586 RepID=A0A4R1KS27_9FLAO|nr:hypothetical protein [Winogradskyella wandonensis]TCK67834.1 hypothetical protein DFQ05_1615 [Winogradskyella wandonensis]
MKITSFYFLFFALITLSGFAQNYRIQNSVGIYAGLTQFDIETSDLITKKNNGWHVGLAATVDLPHRWYNVSYNIQLAENKIGVLAMPVGGLQEEALDYKLFTAQIALVGHLKLIKNNLTLDAGPMLQYNSTLNLEDDSKENYIVSGYNTVRAQDITEISRFNVNGTVGLSLGFDTFKLRGQYIYGFTNLLNKLNNQNFLETVNFKGNQSMLVFSAMFLF